MELVQGAVAGLAVGGLYAAIAVCLVLMSRLVKVVNFSQSAIGMMGAFASVWLNEHGTPEGLAIVMGIVLGGILSAVIGAVLATWLSEADVNTRSAVTVAGMLLLISASFLLFGTKPLPFQQLVSGAAFHIGSVAVSGVTVICVALAMLIAVLASQVLARTMVGVRLRALSERPTTAELIGIPSRRLSIGLWVGTGIIATFVVTIVAPSQSNDATSLSLLIIPAAAAALLGGFRRLDLAVVGGLMFGMIQGALAQYNSLNLLDDFLPFLVIVVLLTWAQRKEVWDAAR